MTTKAENERLTRVGRGTPMGELLRRYWHPVAATMETVWPSAGAPATGREYTTIFEAIPPRIPQQRSPGVLRSLRVSDKRNGCASACDTAMPSRPTKTQQHTPLRALERGGKGSEA